MKSTELSLGDDLFADEDVSGSSSGVRSPQVPSGPRSMFSQGITFANSTDPLQDDDEGLPRMSSFTATDMSQPTLGSRKTTAVGRDTFAATSQRLLSFSTMSSKSRHNSTAAKADHLERSKSGKDLHREEVLKRRVTQDKHLHEERERILEGSRSRLHGATERKAQMAQSALTSRHTGWTVCLVLARFQQKLLATCTAMQRRKVLHTIHFPRMQLLARRWLREIRTRLAVRNGAAVRPTAAVLKADKTLMLFSDEHLDFLAQHLQLRYYFVNETIIFMGSEDSEFFALSSGAVDVLVGDVRVGHINTSGAVFGSVGMISGEPRTATIIAREPCIVWVGTRAEFEAFGMTGSRVEEALGIIAELRQKNMRTVYKRFLTSTYLQSFKLMSTLALSTLEDMLVNHATPLITKPGAPLLFPFLPHATKRSTNHAWYFLLRGTIRIVLHEQAEQLGGATPSLRELVQRLVQFPVRSKVTFVEDAGAKGTVAHPSLAHLDLPVSGARVQVGTRALIPSGGTVATINGPVLVNLGPLVAGETLPFSVEAQTGCDLMRLPRSVLTSMDMLELDNIRLQYQRLHHEFISPLSSRQAKAAICSLSWAASLVFLKHLEPTATTHLHQRTELIFAQESLYFDVAHGLEAYVVLAGEIESPAGAAKPVTPFLWPDVSMVYFGSIDARCTAKTQLDVVRIRRKDIVDWFALTLQPSDMSTLIASLTSLFEAQVHAKPRFSFEGLEANDKASDARDADAIRRKKTVLALHRTANFNCDPEPAMRSQERSMAAALAYQSAIEPEGESEFAPAKAKRKKSAAPLGFGKGLARADEEEDDDSQAFGAANTSGHFDEDEHEDSQEAELLSPLEPNHTDAFPTLGAGGAAAGGAAQDDDDDIDDYCLDDEDVLSGMNAFDEPHPPNDGASKSKFHIRAPMLREQSERFSRSCASHPKGESNVSLSNPSFGTAPVLMQAPATPSKSPLQEGNLTSPPSPRVPDQRLLCEGGYSMISAVTALREMDVFSLDDVVKKPSINTSGTSVAGKSWMSTAPQTPRGHHPPAKSPRSVSTVNTPSHLTLAKPVQVTHIYDASILGTSSHSHVNINLASSAVCYPVVPPASSAPVKSPQRLSLSLHKQPLTSPPQSSQQFSYHGPPLPKQQAPTSSAPRPKTTAHPTIRIQNLLSQDSPRTEEEDSGLRSPHTVATTRTCSSDSSAHATNANQRKIQKAKGPRADRSKEPPSAKLNSLLTSIRESNASSSARSGAQLLSDDGEEQRVVQYLPAQHPRPTTTSRLSRLR